MSSPKALTYWIAAALEFRNPTNGNSPHGSKAYLDIQVNYATVSGTWEKCAS
jgi:hypothetical protein